MADTLRIIPLGGLGEIGKNMMLFEQGRDLLVVDAGIMFPEHDMWGIDVVIPDFSYLHEDHIGGLPYLLGGVLPRNTPVYATRLACGLIQARLSEDPGHGRASQHPIDPGQGFRAGPFEVEFLSITHSIPDGVGLAITTDVGRIIHTGDFKFDYTPVRGGGPGFTRLGELGGRGVLALLSDSTGAERAGHTPSEAVIVPAFDRIFREAPGRIIVATFASLLSRVQQVINAAHQHGRVVALAGYSMLRTAEIARKLGHLEIPPGVLVDLGETRRMADNRIAIVTTGSQGQPEAALARIAEGTHRQIEIQPGDTVVLSSTPIPGNEEEVARLINKLFKRGADVIYPPLADVHVSGHASQEEQKLMLALTKPRFFVPIHGELRHLHAHARLARQLGIPSESIFILEDGTVLELTADSARIAEHMASENVFVDGSGVGDIGPAVMGEREILARDGFVIAIVPVTYSGDHVEVSGKPELLSRGFVYLPESKELMERAADRAWSAATSERGKASLQAIVGRTEEALGRFFYEETRRKPMVLAIVTQT
jgi:ribonuclease J